MNVQLEGSLLPQGSGTSMSAMVLLESPRGENLLTYEGLRKEVIILSLVELISSVVVICYVVVDEKLSVSIAMLLSLFCWFACMVTWA